MIKSIALDVGLCVDRLLGVINDKDVAAEPGQGSVDRCRFPESANGGPYLVFQTSSNSHLVERPLIPAQFDNRTEIAGVLR